MGLTRSADSQALTTRRSMRAACQAGFTHLCMGAHPQSGLRQACAGGQDVKRFMESSWAKLGPQKEEAALKPPPQAPPPTAPKPITPSQHPRGHLQPPESLSPTLPTGHGHFREPSTSGPLHSRNSSGGADASGTVSPPKVEGRPATAPASELSCAPLSDGALAAGGAGHCVQAAPPPPLPDGVQAAGGAGPGKGGFWVVLAVTWQLAWLVALHLMAAGCGSCENRALDASTCICSTD